MARQVASKAQELKEPGAVWKIYVGGPAQKVPNFQIACMTQKSGQNCCMYSPDGGPKVSLKKIDFFMVC